MLVILFCCLLCWGIWKDRLPPGVLIALGAINAATFIAYWLDKRAAQLAARRTPETTLHLLELLGGWPAAWLAQLSLRHKSRKESYRLAFLVAAIVNFSALLSFVYVAPMTP